MYVVIFRATVREFDSGYQAVARRPRELALGQYACLDFHAVTEENDEVAHSYWPDQESIRAWRADAEHVLAQQLGRERWYQSFHVPVAEISREYRFESGPGVEPEPGGQRCPPVG